MDVMCSAPQWLHHFHEQKKKKLRVWLDNVRCVLARPLSLGLTPLTVDLVLSLNTTSICCSTACSDPSLSPDSQDQLQDDVVLKDTEIAALSDKETVNNENDDQNLGGKRRGPRPPSRQAAGDAEGGVRCHPQTQPDTSGSSLARRPALT
ncbi:hypothetical protein INR49_026745 [Caranx melampygus]|nr:hypothetical protein INR49_026745 [Caranx melampygus]